MTDTSQVEAAIVSMLGAAIYPNGTAFPSIFTANANIERGWPTEADIRTAVAAGQVLVRVFAIKGLSKDDTRYPRQWLDATLPALTVNATLSGYEITFAGTPSVGQYIGVLSNNIGYTYVVAASDTLSTIVSSLAAEIPGASASGVVLTLPNANTLPEVTIQQGGNSSVEVARECQEFTITTWAPSPTLRDTVMQALSATTAFNYRLTLPDGSIATLMDIQTTGPDDWPSRAKEWRRDLRATYDFPVLYTQNFPPVTAVIQQNTPAPGDTTITFYNV